MQAARFILYNTWKAEEDKQGRILLPDNLREYAGITKNVVVYKGPTCVEIWDSERWKEYFNSVKFDNLADAMDSLKNG